MAQATMEDVRLWQGKKVIDSQGKKVGTIDDVYFDAQTGQPEWAMINTGMFGTKHNFVPLSTEQQQAGQDQIQVRWTEDQIKSAPKIDPDQELSQDEERELYSYYGLDWQQSQSQTTYPGGQQEREQYRQPQHQGGQQGYAAPDAMTRSEEEVRVGTVRRPSELVRLRKYVVTENVQQTVPVSREEVRIEREPITEANRGKAMEGPEITESQHEVTLMHEEPTVSKQVVPKERVRLDKDVVTGEEQVSEEVRKEKIDVERGGKKDW